MEKKILSSEVPTLTIKESRKVANILKNAESDDTISLAVKMGASSKLHFTVDTLKDDMYVVDSNIKKCIKEEVVYTTLFDYGIEDKETVVYSTGEGEIALVKKGATSFKFKPEYFNYHCVEIFKRLISICETSTDETLLHALAKLKIALPYCKVRFVLDKEALKASYKDGSIPSEMKAYLKPLTETVPMFDILYTEKEGEE